MTTAVLIILFPIESYSLNYLHFDQKKNKFSMHLIGRIKIKYPKAIFVTCLEDSNLSKKKRSNSKRKLLFCQENFNEHNFTTLTYEYFEYNGTCITKRSYSMRSFPHYVSAVFFNWNQNADIKKHIALLQQNTSYKF